MIETRIQQKHDVESNWSSSNAVIPKDGELIIYDREVGVDVITGDLKYTLPRIKIGNGTDKAKDLPFVTVPVHVGMDAPGTMGTSSSEALWVDITDASKPVLKYYNTSNHQWVPVGGSSVPTTYVTYTVCYNEFDYDPSSSWYEDDAVDMTAGSSQWDEQPIFKDIKPCLFRDGRVVTYLNKNNFNQTVSGETFTTQANDDYMIEFPKIGFRITKNEDDGIVKVSITNEPNKVGFSYRAFLDNKGIEQEYMYMGAFLGSTSNNMLDSKPNVNPTTSVTLDNFRTYAHNKGNRYRVMSFYPVTLIQCLYLVKYGTRDSQSACGYGASDETYVRQCGNTMLRGMNFAGNYDTPQMKLFGIEDLWGNKQSYLDGIYSTMGSFDEYNPHTNIGLTISMENTDSDPLILGYDTGIDTNGGDVMMAFSRAGFMIISYANNELGFLPMYCEPYYIDGYYSDAPSIFADRIAVFGGTNRGGSENGIFTIGVCIAAWDDESSGTWNEKYPYSNTTARLMYV